MTNGDKIRSMTDEELAEERAEMLVDFIEKMQGALKRHKLKYDRQQLVDGYLIWLKQEASE